MVAKQSGGSSSCCRSSASQVDLIRWTNVCHCEGESARISFSPSAPLSRREAWANGGRFDSRGYRRAGLFASSSGRGAEGRRHGECGEGRMLRVRARAQGVKSSSHRPSISPASLLKSSFPRIVGKAGLAHESHLFGLLGRRFGPTRRCRAASAQCRKRSIRH